MDFTEEHDFVIKKIGRAHHFWRLGVTIKSHVVLKMGAYDILKYRQLFWSHLVMELLWYVDVVY